MNLHFDSSERGRIETFVLPNEANPWRIGMGILVILWGVLTGSYLMWCEHRISLEVLMNDPAWPQPLPYPDNWLYDWYARIDAANPPPPGSKKMCGEWYRLRTRLMAYILPDCAIIAVGVAIILWPTGRHSSQWNSVRSGVAIGLVVGVAWTACLGHVSDESGPRWESLVVFTIGFTITGAVVGAVREYPKLVGLGVGFLTLLLLEWKVKPDYGNFPTFLWLRHLELQEWLYVFTGFNWDPNRFVIFGGSGLLWGTILGAIHRRFGTTSSGQQNRYRSDWAWNE